MNIATYAKTAVCQRAKRSVIISTLLAAAKISDNVSRLSFKSVAREISAAPYDPDCEDRSLADFPAVQLLHEKNLQFFMSTASLVAEFKGCKLSRKVTIIKS